MPQIFITKEQIVNGPSLTNWPETPPGHGHKMSCSSSDVAKLLTKIEWGDTVERCPCCFSAPYLGHVEGCWLNNILRLCWAEHPGRFDQLWLTPEQRNTSPLPEPSK